MSASGGPTADDLQQEFPISSEEAQAIADAMDPIQNIATMGSALGSGLEQAPGSGTSLAGAVLQNMSTQVDLASVSAETLARAITFYIEAQQESIETLFPPPHVAVQQFGEDMEPLVELLSEPAVGESL
jgi:hypothetical protein